MLVLGLSRARGSSSLLTLLHVGVELGVKLVPHLLGEAKTTQLGKDLLHVELLGLCQLAFRELE